MVEILIKIEDEHFQKIRKSIADKLAHSGINDDGDKFFNLILLGLDYNAKAINFKLDENGKILGDRLY